MFEQIIAQAIDEALQETVMPHSLMGEQAEAFVFTSLTAGQEPDWLAAELLRRSVEADSRTLSDVQRDLLKFTV